MENLSGYKKKKFQGKVLVITNPIDLMAWCLYYFSQLGDSGNLDWQGIFSPQIFGVGPGLDYRRLQVSFPHTRLDIAGQHGNLLVLTQLSQHGSLIKVNRPRILNKVLNFSQAIRAGVSRTRFGPAHESLSIISSLNSDQLKEVRVSTLTPNKVFLSQTASINLSGLLHPMQVETKNLKNILKDAIQQQLQFQSLILKCLSLPPLKK